MHIDYIEGDELCSCVDLVPEQNWYGCGSHWLYSFSAETKQRIKQCLSAAFCHNPFYRRLTEQDFCLAVVVYENLRHIPFVYVHVDYHCIFVWETC